MDLSRLQASLVKQISESAFVYDPYFQSHRQAGNCPLILVPRQKKSFYPFQLLPSWGRTLWNWLTKHQDNFSHVWSSPSLFALVLTKVWLFNPLEYKFWGCGLRSRERGKMSQLALTLGWHSQSGPWTSITASPGSLLEAQTLRPCPTAYGTRICILTRSKGDSHGHFGKHSPRRVNWLQVKKPCT